jgi:hypothetical protein
MKRLIFNPEYKQLQATTQQHIERELTPHRERWERERIVDHSAHIAAGKYAQIGFNFAGKPFCGNTMSIVSVRTDQHIRFAGAPGRAREELSD